MNQTAYYRIQYFLLLVLLLSTPSYGKLLKPSHNGEKKEILIINSKRRLYYSVDSEGVTYTVTGPTRVELISRYPVPKRTKQRQNFRYLIIVDNKDTIKVNHRYKIQKSIRSVQHPNHSYTFSGNYFINLEEGQHSVELITETDQQYPVLLRVLSKEFDTPGDNSRILIPMVHQRARRVKIESSEVQYFQGNYTVPLQVNTTGPKTIRIFSRLEFENWMGEQEVYRLRIRSENKVIGTYYFNTERSSEAIVVEQADRVPGKWRTCEILVPKGENTYTVEVVEKDRNVLMRFLEF
ncbi:MAG: hypothetical protein HQ509_06060 [Candidatus Marinimicrobia bacterium]|nr:hypothetical protein [Candidatus Neomarinimicrobiota bacterium]